MSSSSCAFVFSGYPRGILCFVFALLDKFCCLLLDTRGTAFVLGRLQEGDLSFPFRRISSVCATG